MSTDYVAVWIDYAEAKIFHVDVATFTETTVHAPNHSVSRKAEEQGRHALSDTYFAAVAKLLPAAHHILIVGPSSAKLDLLRYLHKHDHVLADKIAGIETLDHPSDKQLAAYVRHYFVDKANKGELA
ncbi:MAG: translational machinery protein [Deltaproteobacteria bacterium]